MTLQVWSILVNAVIAALILVGGIWLRSVVTQQLKSKDTAIQALDATIKSKEAEISALVNDRAPAIAKAYAQMREHANQMTEETQHLQDRFEVLSGKQQLKETLIPAREILAQVKGLQWAFNILIEDVETIIRSDAVPASNSIMEEATGFLRRHQLLGKACVDTLSLLQTEQKSRIHKAEQLVNALADSIK